MNHRHHVLPLATAIALIPWVLTLPAQAQEDDLGTLVGKSISAMKAEKWEEALAYNQQAVDRYGKNQPLKLFGARFGTIYYRKGLCELKLGKFAEAMRSFETCTNDFPNAGTDGGNQFEKMAILKGAEAAMGAQDFKLAIGMFQRFLKEHDKNRDKFSLGSFHVSLAICSYRLGDIPAGNTQLEIAIKNKERFPTTDQAILSAFQALLSGAILKRDEQALLDFIQKFRGELICEPYAMQRFSKVYMKLAGEAVAADMQRAAMALYQFVPSTDACIEDLRFRLNSIGKVTSVRDGTSLLVNKKLDAELKQLESERRGKRMTEMVKLAAMAYLHEKNGNIRGAYAAYSQLEAYYPQAEKREDNLFNLVRTSALVAEGPQTQKYAEEFVKSFPNSPHIPVVRRLMLSSLFSEGEYDTCIEVAEPMLPKLQEGSNEHDICLHVLGGSYYYTGQYDKAESLLNQHVAKYPNSVFALSAQFFQASNTVRLQYWEKAASLLDEFIKAHSDPSKNVFLPFAFYDRATCYYAQDQPEAALAALERIIREFSSSVIVDQAYNLKGNVEQSLNQYENAEKSYLKGLEIAETRRHGQVAAESLYSLVALTGNPALKRSEEQLQAALPYSETFWQKYSDGSPYRARMAVAQLPVLNAAGKGEDALSRLQEVVADLAKDPEARGLEELINSYTDAYLARHTPEQLKEHYYHFPGIRSGDRAARALLRVAVIGVFEGVVKKSDDEARKRAGTAMIKVLFQELKNDFQLKDLTNFILVKVGDYLRTSTSTPREALPYYDEALGRQDQSYRFGALLGRADVYGRSSSPAEIEKGLADLGRVYADSQDKNEREFALFRTVELLMAKKDYAKANEQAKIYLDRDKTAFTKHTAQVGLLMAESFKEQNMVNDALAMYAKVWNTHMGNIKVSAPAVLAWMKMSWDRNQPSAGPDVPNDRQGAYNGGARFIELTGRFRDKMIEEDLALWKQVEALVRTYEADPNIKSVEQQKREKEAKKRR